jgi:cellobiose phosphorylase
MMDRKGFITTALVAGAASIGHASDTIPAAKAEPLQQLINEAQSGNELGGSPYFVFSEDGTECHIKRYDTPIPWLNLLNNDSFQVWITHRGHVEAMLLDRGLFGLTNPGTGTGNVYLRDKNSKLYMRINKPPKSASWEASHGLGFTRMSMRSLDLAMHATCFVPRASNSLVWKIEVFNETNVTRTLDLFSTVEWSLGDQFKTMVFEGHGGGGDNFTGGSQFNLYKKVVAKGRGLYATQSHWALTSARGRIRDS